jgi:hypothetical protein
MSIRTAVYFNRTICKQTGASSTHSHSACTPKLLRYSTTASRPMSCAFLIALLPNLFVAEEEVGCAARCVLAAHDYSFNMLGSAFLAIRALITSISPLTHAWCSGVSPNPLHNASQSRVAHRSQRAAKARGTAAAEVIAIMQRRFAALTRPLRSGLHRHPVAFQQCPDSRTCMPRAA